MKKVIRKLWRVSVVIPAHNEEKALPRLLDSLQLQTVLPDEIIVVNNNSTDGTVDVAKKYHVKIINESKQGLTHARDAGLNAAKYDLIFRFDADSVIPSNYIEQMKMVFQNEDIIAASARVVFEKLPVYMPHKLIEIPFNYSVKAIRWKDTLLGPNIVMRKTAWLQVKDKVCSLNGKFNEDLDLSIHLSQIGKIKQIRDVVVYTSSRRILKNPHSFFLIYPAWMILTLLSHWRDKV